LGKIRIDTLLVNKGLTPSREKARALILAGEVRVNGNLVDKAGTNVDEDDHIEVKTNSLKYVSRGGLKLEGAIHDFNLDFTGKTVLDVGASTGGYTDCALKHGAVKVLALDVGYGQLDWSLRNDPRVVVIERTNIRYVTAEQLGQLVDIITIDVSFISTRLLFPVLASLLKEDGEIACLIKPQFEAGKDKVGKKGVVKDPQTHMDVLHSCINAAQEIGLYCMGVCFSPIKGPQGNIEYFIHLTKQLELMEHAITENISQVVLAAHSTLEAKR
jgi:23S rRNA (cytidine1920-2'-O)/16S rRNA (cytidine1409-2'-O)-methyltransferase